MTKSQYYPSESNRQYEVFADISFDETGIISRLNIEKVIDYNTEEEIDLIDIDDKVMEKMEDLFYE